MTTEIAVLNRLGVALATDSAVTISDRRGGRSKVFNSADKLFELSCDHPVAIMVNGSTDCFGAPWEIIIKDFRDSVAGHPHQTLHKWAEDFLQYASNHTDLGQSAEVNYARETVRFEVEWIKQDVMEFIWSGPNSAAREEPAVNAIRKFSEGRTKFLQDMYDIAEHLQDVQISEIENRYGSEIDRLIIEGFAPVPIDNDALSVIRNQMIEALIRVKDYHGSTGLIVAGYGVNEGFPAVNSINIDGILFHRLKHTPIKDDASISTDDRGRVVSFAQTDVIDRLLGGVDPSFVFNSAEIISQGIERIGSTLEQFGKTRRWSKAEKKARADVIKDLAKIAEDEYFEAVEKMRDEFRVEFEGMIAMMPRTELIEFAEALINITAIERKASSDEGSVGGPIDVAFITKHEGFVWIKRKYYFEAAKNPRYFWRKYGLKP